MKSSDYMDKKPLSDIKKVEVDSTLSYSQRMQGYLDQICDPYHFLCGDTPVRICFSEEGKDLAVCLKEYLLDLKKS